MAPPRLPREKISAQLRKGRAVAHETSFVRQTYKQERTKARETAKRWFRDYPKAAYWTQVESWRLLDGDIVEFTMRRLPTAD